MKKITPQKLSKRLTQYGALSLAIAGVADASGQIIYTDINPDIGGAGVTYQLDIDNDATPDFTIRNVSVGDGLGYVGLGVLRVVGNGVLGISAGASNYPFALAEL